MLRRKEDIVTATRLRVRLERQMHRPRRRGPSSKISIRLLSVIALLIGPLIVAGPAHATFPGRNGSIAFEGLQLGNRSEIFTVRADRTHLRQLTHEPNGMSAHVPRWSPDGRRITYCVTTGSCEAGLGSNAQIWVMNRDGSGQHQVRDDPGFYDADPNWAPDGHHIIFTRCSNFYGTCDIAAMRDDGTHIHKLVGGHWHHAAPAYSPDGSFIAFTSDKGGYDSRVWVANRDGSNPHPVTPAPLIGGGSNWSPDGSRIFFTGDSFQNGRVWTVAPDGSHLHQLTHFLSYSGSYSPDGQKLLATDFDVPGCGCNGLVLLNRDGSIRRRVITAQRVRGLAAWTFDWGVAP
jgi:TolB protein